MNGRLNKKVAVVTGSGRGIGKAIATRFAAEGAGVVTNAAHAGAAESVAEEIARSGGDAISFTGDISRFDVAGKLIQSAIDRFGRVDILVNNAGIATGLKSIWELGEDDWDAMIAVHLKGTFNCVRHVAPLMKQQKWGRIINTTSRARLGLRHNANYGAAKAGVVGLTRCVAVDLAPFGITCNAYSASAATRMTSTDELKERLQRSLQAGEITRDFHDSLINLDAPESLAPLVVYLCTDEAAGINGQVFSITKRDIHVYTEELRNSVFNEDGWTIEGLAEQVPGALLQGMVSQIGPKR